MDRQAFAFMLGRILLVQRIAGIADDVQEHLLELARARHRQVEAGRFGADMQVGLVNDGPVTFWLNVKAPAPAPRQRGARAGRVRTAFWWLVGYA